MSKQHEVHCSKVVQSSMIISSTAFAIFLLWKFRAQTHNPCICNSKLCFLPTPSEFQSKKPPLPKNSKVLPVVWYGYFLESTELMNILLDKLTTSLAWMS